MIRDTLVKKQKIIYQKLNHFKLSNQEGDLRHKISKKKTGSIVYDFEDIYRWSTQIIRGLELLHSNFQIIHRDIKPE